MPVVDRDDSVEPLDPLDFVEASDTTVRVDAVSTSLGARSDKGLPGDGLEPDDAALPLALAAGTTGGAGFPVPLLPLSLEAPEDIST